MGLMPDRTYKRCVEPVYYHDATRPFIVFHENDLYLDTDSIFKESFFIGPIPEPDMEQFNG